MRVAAFPDAIAYSGAFLEMNMGTRGALFSLWLLAAAANTTTLHEATVRSALRVGKYKSLCHTKEIVPSLASMAGGEP